MKAKAVVHISNTRVELNGNPVFKNAVFSLNEIPFKRMYNELGIQYSKFHKMDNLSKLGFLGVEILKREVSFSNYKSGRIAQVFQNSHASLDTDVIHQQAINSGKMPSPAVFVYTLPNIVMGEIAIRNKLYGENLFILADAFLPKEWLKLINLQFKVNKADAVLGGWIEFFENSFELRLYFIDKTASDKGFNVI